MNKNVLITLREYLTPNTEKLIFKDTPGINSALTQ